MAKKWTNAIILIFNGSYVSEIDGAAIYTVKDPHDGALAFNSVEQATQYALQSGLPDRYLQKLKYQHIEYR
jgi:hypothetical protein